MRDILRIERILDALWEYWTEHPDLRLGQIISNATPVRQDVFYLSDDHLEKWLEDAIIAER